ncbi:MAG: hypothetical protein V1821_03890 [bacterium]
MNTNLNNDADATSEDLKVDPNLTESEDALDSDLVDLEEEVLEDDEEDDA